MSEDSFEAAVSGLLLAENLGNVHDQWNLLCRAVGVELDGNYLDGFSTSDEERLTAALRSAAIQ